MPYNSTPRLLTNVMPDESTPEAKAAFVKNCVMIPGDVISRVCLVDSTNPTIAISLTISLWGYSEKANTWVHIKDVTINSPRGGSEDVTDQISPFSRIHVQGNRANTNWFLALTQV